MKKILTRNHKPADTMKKTLLYLAVFSIFFVCNARADEMDAMLFEPAPKITAAKKKPTAPAKTSITPSVKGGVVMKPEAVSDAEFESIEAALPEEETALRAPAVQKPAALSNKTAGKGTAKGKTQKSLTDAIRETAGEEEDEGSSPLAGTWVEKLANTALSSSKEEDEDGGENGRGVGSINLESMVKNSKNGNRRSNASVFDISGIMLRMNLPQAEATMAKRGFKKVSQKFEIPNFIKWRFEEQCRNAGVVGYERLASCVVKAAKENNHQYVESEKFVKYDTQEEISISLTSNFTNNKIYKIVYKSMSARKIQGSSQKVQYLRDIKVYDFWRKINQKYGVPDNREDVIWGMGGNKPYMKAATGFLLLEDPMLKELDYTRMSREDQKYMNTTLYNF